MRRVLSILLALAFGLEPLAFAIDYNDSASLPACCRRHGAHHCAMASATQSDSADEGTAALTSPVHCPRFPAHQNATPSSVSAIVHWPSSVPMTVEPAPPTDAKLFANGAANLCTFTLRGPPGTPIFA